MKTYTKYIAIFSFLAISAMNAKEVDENIYLLSGYCSNAQAQNDAFGIGQGAKVSSCMQIAKPFGVKFNPVSANSAGSTGFAGMSFSTNPNTGCWYSAAPDDLSSPVPCNSNPSFVLGAALGGFLPNANLEFTYDSTTKMWTPGNCLQNDGQSACVAGKSFEAVRTACPANIQSTNCFKFSQGSGQSVVQGSADTKRALSQVQLPMRRQAYKR